MMFAFRIKLKRICVYRNRKQIGDGDFVKLLERRNFVRGLIVDSKERLINLGE